MRLFFRPLLHVHTHYSFVPSLCAYRQHYLHERNLKEMTALQAQLSRAVTQKPPSQQLGLTSSQQNAGGPAQEPCSPAAAPLPAPSAFTVHELRKAIAAGWVDQVCIWPLFFVIINYLLHKC